MKALALLALVTHIISMESYGAGKTPFVTASTLKRPPTRPAERPPIRPAHAKPF